MLGSRAMKWAALAISLSMGCSDGGGGTPDAPSAACVEATTYQDIAKIETAIFAAHCNFSGCHKAATTASELELEPGSAHANLVNVASDLDPSRMLVVPGDPKSSYLLYMIEAVAPADMTPAAPATPPTDEGFMPGRTAEPVCKEKRDAIHRWIEAGAPAS